MNKNLRSSLVLVLIIMSTLACGLPRQGGNEPDSNDATSPDQVATIVASTLQALTPAGAGITDPPVPSSDLLPHSLYFLNNDDAGIAQVYRLEADGKSLSQVTFEPTAVEFYDVSPVDGSVAYISNNQLLLIQADGSNRRVLVDAGPKDPNDPFVTGIRFPAFSPNGQTIAYGYKGLNFYAVATDVSNRVLEDQLDDLGNNLIVVREAYSPDQYSTDGTKLLLTLHYYEGGSAAIYYPAANSLVRLTGDEGALICCGEPEWTQDGSAFFVGNPTIGMFNPGLWRVDVSNGKVTTLLAGDAGNGTFNFADEPYLAPDGQLYFFFANQSATDEFVSRAPLQLVRSAADGITNRSVISPESFQLMNEALWAPDASLVIVANAPIAEVYQGGPLELYYTDGQKNMVSLLPFGGQLKWGP